MAALLLMAAIPGCAPFQAPVKAPQGLLYTHTRQPLTVHYASTPAGDGVTRHGSATSFYLYDPFFTNARIAFGQVAIDQIARTARIREIAFADYETQLFLSIVGVFTIHVYGN